MLVRILSFHGFNQDCQDYSDDGVHNKPINLESKTSNMDKNPKTLNTSPLIWNIKTSDHKGNPMNLEQKSSSL